MGFFLHVLKRTGNKLLIFIIKRKERLLVRVFKYKNYNMDTFYYK